MRKLGFEDDWVFYDIAVKADREKIDKLIERAKIGDDQSSTELIDLIIMGKCNAQLKVRMLWKRYP